MAVYIMQVYVFCYGLTEKARRPIIIIIIVNQMLSNE